MMVVPMTWGQRIASLCKSTALRGSRRALNVALSYQRHRQVESLPCLCQVSTSNALRTLSHFFEPHKRHSLHQPTDLGVLERSYTSFTVLVEIIAKAKLVPSFRDVLGR